MSRQHCGETKRATEAFAHVWVPGLQLLWPSSWLVTYEAPLPSLMQPLWVKFSFPWKKAWRLLMTWRIFVLLGFPVLLNLLSFSNLLSIGKLFLFSLLTENDLLLSWGKGMEQVFAYFSRNTYSSNQYSYIFINLFVHTYICPSINLMFMSSHQRAGIGVGGEVLCSISQLSERK